MKNKRVLIVDDHHDILEMLALFLHHFGYEPILVKTGRDALEKAASDSPALIILDLALPDISGVEVVTLLKQNPKTSGIRVVILTALAADSWEEAARRAGASEVLSKPCSLDQLRRIVERLTGESDETSLDRGPKRANSESIYVDGTRSRWEP